MKWQGETENQWMTRTLGWQRRFALLPTQMECGSWVWLTHYETRREPWNGDGWFWVKRMIGSTDYEPGADVAQPSMHGWTGSVQPRAAPKTTPPPCDN